MVAVGACLGDYGLNQVTVFRVRVRVRKLYLIDIRDRLKVKGQGLDQVSVLRVRLRGRVAAQRQG